MLRLLCIVLILSANAAHGASEPERCCVPIQMEVAQKVGKDGLPVLAIKLTNTGTTPVTFAIGSGPWVGVHQIQLVAIKLALGGAVPNELVSLRDPALGSMTIDPGQSREEDVPLRYLYPELAAELRTQKGEYVLFWTYQLHAESGISQRLGGWLIVKSQATL